METEPNEIDESFRIPDEMWERVKPLLPAEPPKPKGGHPRNDDREMMEYDSAKGIEWEWQARDGAMTKAPLGGEGTGPNPTGRSKSGTKRSLRSGGFRIGSYSRMRVLRTLDDASLKVTTRME